LVKAFYTNSPSFHQNMYSSFCKNDRKKHLQLHLHNDGISHVVFVLCLKWDASVKYQWHDANNSFWI
jgi:hypothetical protein